MKKLYPILLITILFISVTKKSYGLTNQTITFSNVTKTYGIANFSPATASSGLPVTYVSSDPSVAIVVNGGTQIQIVGVGITSITASQAGNGTYNPAANVTKTLTVVKATLTVTPHNSSREYGEVNPTFILNYSGFAYGEGISVLNTEPIVTTSIVKTTNAGTYNIKASGGVDNNYKFTYITGQLTITRATLTVTADNKTKTYGSDNPVFTLTYYGFKNSDGTSKITKPTATTTATKTSPVGTYPITVSGGSATNYIFKYVDGTLSIKASQTINFPDQPEIPFNTADFSPATASSGLPISYSTSNPGVIIIVGGKLHVVGVGQAYVVASQAGNSYYGPATNVSRLITVGKSNQTISFSNIIKTYNDPEFNPGAVASSGLVVTYTIGDASIAIPSFNGVTIVGAGTTTITATQVGNDSYNPVSKTVTLTVNKASQILTFPSLYPVDYGFTDFNPGATSDSYLTVIYSSDNTTVATIVDNMIHIVGAGTANITASQPGNNNYKPATDIIKVLTVNKASQTITFNSIQSRIYNDPDFPLNAVSSSGLSISYTSSITSVASISGNVVHITGVGNTVISASQSGNSNYLPATTVTQTFEVSKSPQTISFTSIPQKAIGAPDFALTATSSSGLAISYVCDNPSVATISGGVVHIVGTGTANIKASQGGNTYYLPASDIARVLIVKNSSQTISFSALPVKTYGDADFSVTATASSGLPVTFISDNTNIATITGNVVKIVGAGVVNIYAMQAGDDDYAEATPVPQPLTVNKASQSITFPALPTVNYNDPPFPAGASASSGLSVNYVSSNPSVAQIVEGQIYITGVGLTTITASQGGNNNYLQATPFLQILDVQKTAQTITFGAIPSKAYGDADFALDATTTSGLQIVFTSSNTNVATILGNKVHIVGAGTCIITASQPGDDNYYIATSKSQVFVVEKVSQTISFDELTPVSYGSEDFPLEATSSSGLPVVFSSSNTNTVTISSGFAHVINTGSAYITASQSGNLNYNSAIPVSRLLVVNKQDQIIIFDTIPEKTYGNSDFDLGAISSSGLPVTYMIDNSNVAYMKNGKVHIVGAGSTVVTVKQNGNNSYNATTENVSRVLVIKKATLIVTPVKATRNYQVADPLFTATYSGFVNGENFAVIDVLPVITSNTDISSFPGIYELTASGGLDKNYDFVYNKGIFIVLGTMPLKPSKPYGNSKLCINPGNQEYKTSGAVFGATYIWSVTPENAGIVTTSGKTLNILFNENFIGRVGIAVKSENNQGFSDVSDTLCVDVLALPVETEVSLRGTYCSTNNWGDSIKIPESQKDYEYQLSLNGLIYSEIVTGTGGRIGWGNLKEGTYSITETVCNVSIADGLEIIKVDPSSSKPQLVVKWNDVVVCRNGGDSIEGYQWFKDGIMLPGEINQYIWTLKQEGYYSVSTADITGCVFSSDSVWIDKQPTGQIYPNPNDGNFKLSFSSSEMGKVIVRVSSINSIAVRDFNFSKEEELFETDISIPDLKTGIYYLEVLLKGERVFYEKFIRN